MLVNHEGILSEPEFHDGLLRGIHVSADKMLTVEFSTIRGDSFELVLPDVVRLRADNFLEGNIVFDVRIFVGAACPQELVSKAFTYNQAEEDRLLQEKMATITSEKWQMVAVDATYGCDLVAIGRGAVRLTKI